MVVVYKISMLRCVLCWGVVVVLASCVKAYGHPKYREYSVSSCFNTPSKQLTLSCDLGYMVRLIRIYNGFSSSDKCEFEPGDCTQDLEDTEYYNCIGNHECSINLPTGDRGSFNRKCNHYNTYMQAHFQCIPDMAVMDICSSSSFTSQSGFLKTPRYPHNYPTNTNCSIKIKAPYEEQTISFYILDFNLERNGTGCADFIHITDGFQSKTYCAKQSRVKVMDTFSNWLELTFHSNDANRFKGFWLYYEANPFMRLTSPPPTTTTIQYQKNSYTTTTSDNTSNKSGYIIYEVTNTVPLGLVVGVVLGIVLCILLVLLVVLLVRSRDFNKGPPPKNRSSSFLDPHYNKNMQVNYINNEFSNDLPSGLSIQVDDVKVVEKHDNAFIGADKKGNDVLYC